MGLFEKNYDLLLNIFNPEGWLEITYPLNYYYIHNIHSNSMNAFEDLDLYSTKYGWLVLDGLQLT
jgi:hypothetical protein